MPDEVRLKKGLEILTAFNTYSLVKQVGEGGNGKVWKAIDKDGKEFAIKFLERKNSEKVLKRFKNETFFCITHKHENILPILDYGTAGKDYVFYVMPLFAETLRDRVKAGIEPENISVIFTGILKGLSFAHKLGVIHRDIKPENILFMADSFVPVIADFGIAHFSEEDLVTKIETRQGDRMANFQYAAPEQRKKGGVAVPQTDLYSAGLILNEMFTEEIPQASGYKHISDVSPEYGYLDKIFAGLFKQNPNERLYPEEAILTEMGVLATRQKNEAEAKRLREMSISLKKPEEYNPKVVAIKYDSGNLLFELDQTIIDEWFATLAYGSYSHTSVLGYDTNRLKKNGRNVLAMPLRGNVSQETVKDIVNYLKDWIKKANDIYKESEKRLLEREQREKEQQRLLEIQRIERENSLNDFLATL